MGLVEVTSRLSEYRAFGGVRMPTRMTQDMMGMQQVMTISEVHFDGVDPSVIDPPPAIRALIAGNP